ncbi:RNA-directed DNA polymerase, eukaryota [Tanacetum coccineum]
MFKVDFQKAFDSVRWDYLDDILGKFGFGSRWRGWIHGCLQYSKASVLINGSPTDEFLFHRGLRQGDPLSPFLFILVMESLHVAFQRVIERGMFNPVIIGKDDRVSISHLFYAVDAMLIGKWSSSNVSTLVMMLHCFFLASGLKINVKKSSLYGVGVHSSDVQHLVDSFGSLANNLPFTYLGVKWKAKALSVGGRLTLIKSVLGSLPTYYMSMFKVPDGVLNHLDGLRNSFLLGADKDERKMTFYSTQSGLWLDVIKAIYGPNGCLDQPSSTHKGCSVWLMIRNANLKSKGVDLMEFCKKVIGNGNNSSFWHEKWISEECFKVRFNRLLNLDLQRHVSIAQKLQNSDYTSSFRRRSRGGAEECHRQEFTRLLSSVVLSSANDRWSWTLNGNGIFSEVG